jgi:NhaA family Na+:H+ antiporter
VEYIQGLKNIISKFKRNESTTGSLHSKEEAQIIDEALKLSSDAHTPLQNLEHSLHPFVIFFILPIFALSNAGVHVEGNVFDMLMHPISIGIIVGLVGGKFIGITLITRLLVHFKLASLPEGVTWNMIYGMAFLAGIGFTMSMFIADLAFVEDEYIQIAKVGIMFASLIAACLGMLVLIVGLKKRTA